MDEVMGRKGNSAEKGNAIKGVCFGLLAEKIGN